MPWCPNCKNEYVEGIKICADCGCELVASLEKEASAVIFGDQEQMDRLLSFMKYNGLTSPRMQEDKAEQVYEIFVADGEREQARQIARVFLMQESSGQTAGQDETEEEPAETGMQESDVHSDGEQVSRGVYKDNAQKAEEFRDSGYTLLGVGIVGLAVVLLMAAGVIPFSLGGMTYLTYGVMGTMFLVFVIIGIRSMRSAKVYKKEALSESNLKEKIMSWCRDSLTAQEVDETFSGETLFEEEKYFRRTAFIKTKISRKFINIESGFLDNLIDEFYPELFEK